MTRAFFIASMIIFSTIGIVVYPLDIPRSLIVFFRAFFGAVSVFSVIALTGRRMDKNVIIKNLVLLIPSGIALGAGWACLFEAYKLTGVATSTLIYYLAPSFVILASFIFLREKVSVKKILCALVALVGMIPVSGVLNPDTQVKFEGVFFALIAALLYALVVILNKKIKNLSGIEATAIQLAVAAVAMGIYVFCFVLMDDLYFDVGNFRRLLLLGIVHTGLAYVLYFSSVKRIPSSSAALLSYIDPALALILSYTVLDEKPTASGFIGIALILCSSIIAEIRFIKKEKNPSDI